MNDIKRLKDQQREKHPGFDAYMECMTRSLFTGLASFCLGEFSVLALHLNCISSIFYFVLKGFSGLYFVQKIIQTKIRYPLQYNILASTVTATIVAYEVTSKRTKSCQAAWMATENKHTVLKENEY